MSKVIGAGLVYDGCMLGTRVATIHFKGVDNVFRINMSLSLLDKQLEDFYLQR